MIAIDLHRAFEWIKAEYDQFPSDSHPAKSVIHLEKQEGLTTSYLNTMSAKLFDGRFGSKTIYVDEVNGVLQARTLVYSRNGDLYASVDANQLTAKRCGLMAALAMEKMGLLHAGVRVGMIGAGKINAETAHVLYELGGIRAFSIVKRDPTDTSKLSNFPIDSWIVEPHELGICDVVISCTNNATWEKTYGLEDFQRPDFFSEPKLYISQDGGWTLDDSFRDLPSFADDPRQIDRGWDFPFDFGGTDEMLMGLRDLHSLKPRNRPSVVYLTGMAFTDLIMAVVFHEACNAHVSRIEEWANDRYASGGI